MLNTIGILFLVSAAMLTSSASGRTLITVAEARQSLIGQWEGKLEYRDYQSNGWSGIPVKISIKDGGDGVTLFRTADYDDGPKTGNVRITTVSMLAASGIEETAATFRKGRPVELTTATLTVGLASMGKDDWTMVETSVGTDNDRPAILRLSTTRTGSNLVTLKEVDFRDDAKTEWLVRNRTTLSAR